MSSIFGVLDLDSTDRVYVSTVGQVAVYEAIQQMLDDWNADLDAALGVFVEEKTENFKTRYNLPAGGYMQRRGHLGRAGAVQTVGSYDVAFPLEDFGAQVAGDDVSMAYMTVQDLDKHLASIFTQDVNTVRFEMLKALFNENQDSFTDPLNGSLSIEPLANGDTVVYPPVLGAAAGATENHYLESGYLATAISDSNNPFKTIKDELEEHFGVTSGGSDVIVFIHSDERPETEALTAYNEVPDPNLVYGNDTTLARMLASVPGTVIGRASNVWVVEWRWIPSGYMLAIDPNIAGPLLIREDLSETGLPKGLAFMGGDDKKPLETGHWRHRFGFGAGNRLNGVVMELANGGTYTTPTDYA